MSANNPNITASNIITDVEARLGTPNVSTSVYLPWVSYAYQRTFNALLNAGQEIKENLFANLAEITLTNGTGEYSLSTNIPRYGGFIKGEILYGATGDQWIQLEKLRSISHWRIMNNVSTSYRAKEKPLIYFLEDKFGIIPTPPGTDASNAQAKIWYVRRPYQIDDGADVIDIEYRFIYPIVNYVQAKAMEKKYEDYSAGRDIEARFQNELEEIAQAAISEIGENQVMGIEVDSNSPIFNNPLS